MAAIIKLIPFLERRIPTGLHYKKTSRKSVVIEELMNAQKVSSKGHCVCIDIIILEICK
jgi:hypothetical protein